MTPFALVLPHRDACRLIAGLAPDDLTIPLPAADSASLDPLAMPPGAIVMLDGHLPWRSTARPASEPRLSRQGEALRQVWRCLPSATETALGPAITTWAAAAIAALAPQDRLAPTGYYRSLGYDVPAATLPRIVAGNEEACPGMRVYGYDPGIRWHGNICPLVPRTALAQVAAALAAMEDNPDRIRIQASADGSAWTASMTGANDPIDLPVETVATVDGAVVCADLGVLGWDLHDLPVLPSDGDHCWS